MLKKLLTATLVSLAFAGAPQAQAAQAAPAAAANPSAEAPDQLVKRVTQEVLDAAKADKAIQAGNQKRILDLVESKILPHVNFQRMTSLAAGRHWRDATPAQQQALTNEFRTLLVSIYSNALSQVRDQKVEFKPLRAGPGDTDVVVRSVVIQPRAEPLTLEYRMEKQSSGWKIYDINVLGQWLVETYKGTFNTTIGKSGIDGLIRTLADKNRQLAAGNAKSGK